MHFNRLRARVDRELNPALTLRRHGLHVPPVSDSVSPSFLQTLRWLAAHTRFPASRLPVKAETLLLISTAAQQEESAAQAAAAGQFHVKSRDVAKDSALRAHALRRSQVHFKCDNSAKV
jgi:hypothetical protein